MKYIKNINCFLITKDSFKDYQQLQEIRFKDDLTKMGTLYPTYILDGYVKNFRFQQKLLKFTSIGFQNLLFEFHTFEKLSYFEAAVRKKEDQLKHLKDFLDDNSFVVVNPNGGFCTYVPSQEDVIEKYEFIADFVRDNDTMNLIIENDGEIEETLLDFIDSVIKPSSIVHYKDIARNPMVDAFIRSRNDWTIWVYTQGMDKDLYDMFLTTYSNYIDNIMIKTTEEALVDYYEDKYPTIEFKQLSYA